LSDDLVNIKLQIDFVKKDIDLLKYLKNLFAEEILFSTFVAQLTPYPLAAGRVQRSE